RVEESVGSALPRSSINNYQHSHAWEFNILGYINRSQADFSPTTGITIVPEQALENGNGASLTPTCAPATGFTGETNNLTLLPNSCSVNGSIGLVRFTEYN